MQVYWEGEKKWYTGNITKTDVWRGPNGLSKQPRRQIHISYDDGVDKVHSLHNTKVRTVVTDEAETGVEEVSMAAGTSGSSTSVQLDMPPSWPNSPVNTPRPQPDPPSQPPNNGTAPAAAVPSPPSEQLDMPPSWPNSPVNMGALPGGAITSRPGRPAYTPTDSERYTSAYTKVYESVCPVGVGVHCDALPVTCRVSYSLGV